MSEEGNSLRANAELVMTVRRAIQQSLGRTFDGKRDIYAACGYPRVVQHTDFYERYVRGDIAKAIVEAYPDICWQVNPIVWDTDKALVQSPFEKEWQRLVDEVDILSELKQTDILAGLGQYAVMYLGFDDTADLTQPPNKGSKLLYCSAYREGNAKIVESVTDIREVRYGQPLYYQLTSDAGVSGSSVQTNLTKVHYSRVVHVADNRVDSKVLGKSRLEPVWNRLIDIDTIMGGGAEGQWRGGFPGTFFGLDKDARMTPDGKKDFDEQIENYTHNFSRIIRGQGITPHSLSNQVMSPKAQLECEFWLIGATTRIPYRILTGAEQGEMASTKDQDNWNTRGGARRLRFCDPYMLRATIKQLITVGSLPEPKDGKYDTEWPSGREEKESEKIANRASKVKMAAEYISGGVEQMIPRENFMVDYMDMDEEEVQEMLAEADRVAEEQMAQAAADQEAAAQQEVAKAGALAAATSKQPPPGKEPWTPGAEAKQPGSTPPKKAPIKGLRALWDAARQKLGLKEEPVGLQFGDRVEALMPDGMKVNGKIIGADEAGHALLFTEDRKVIALPEMLKKYDTDGGSWYGMS